MQNNVILLGGSNSVMNNGLRKGIQDSLCKRSGAKLYNFALGACTSFQNLYELKRERNKQIFENATLIITESNVNDVYNTHDPYEKLPLNTFYRNLSWFYKELYFLNKKVVSLLLPNEYENYRLINNMHKMLCEKYGFNCIDMQTYYENNGLQEFGKKIDWAHQLETIMYRVGKNIIDSSDTFQMSKKLTITNDNPTFFECTPNKMVIINGKLHENYMGNSMYSERTYRIDSKTTLAFPKQTQGCYLIGIHTWNNIKEWTEDFDTPKTAEEQYLTYSSLKLLSGGGGGETLQRKQIC